MADRTSNVRVNVDANTTGATSKLRGFVGIAGKAALGVGALALGAAVGAGKLYAYADAADDANASIEQGIRTQQIFGKQASEVAQRVEDYAKKTALATATDINQIKTTQAKLLTFKELAKSADVAGGAFDRATVAAVDMAAKGFGSAESNATQLGKALNDPIKGITALTRSGITFTEAEKAKIAAMVESGRVTQAQGFILSAIEKQVGGTAAATAGGFEKMKTAVSIFGQELAGKALPYMDRFGEFMLNKGGPALLDFGRTLENKVGPPLRQFAGFIGDKVIPVIVALIGWVTDHLVPAYSKVLAGALEGARGFIKNVSDALGDNKKELGDLGEAAKKAANFFVDKVIPVMGDVYKNVLPAVGTALGTVIGFIADLVTGFEKVYGAVVLVVNKLGDFKNKLADLPGAGTLGTILGAVTRGGGTPAGTPLSPFTHSPLSRGAAAGGGGGGEQHLHFHFEGTTIVGDEHRAARAILDLLEDAGLRLNGRVTVNGVAA